LLIPINKKRAQLIQDLIIAIAEDTYDSNQPDDSKEKIKKKK